MYILAFDFVSFGVKTAQFILSFSILVVLHELGHFIPSRLFKTRVEKFYLFFNLLFFYDFFFNFDDRQYNYLEVPYSYQIFINSIQLELWNFDLIF